MKNDEILFCCTFRDLNEDRELLPELLAALELDLSSHHDAESGIFTHTLYFKTKEDAEVGRQRLESLRADWKELGAEFGEILQTELPKENWAESWKIHFKPIEISDTLAVVPSWVKFPEKPGRHVVVLDPGMSFGTGRHATTKFCLGALDEIAKTRDVSGLSVLEAGCGTGILAIAAKKLGFGSAEGFDIDPDAVEVAGKNAADNGIHDILFSAASLIEFDSEGRTYDVVAANILSSALLAGKEKLLSLVKPGGILILAGILEKEYTLIRQTFTAAGCTEIRTLADGDWQSGFYRFG